LLVEDRCCFDAQVTLNMGETGTGRPARYFFFLEGLNDDHRRWVFQVDFGNFKLLPAPLLPGLGIHFLADQMVGWYDIPSAAPDDNYSQWAMTAADDFLPHANIVELLLSFALRRHVEISSPSIYVNDGDQWQHRGGGRLRGRYPRRDPGIPLIFGADELTSFIRAAYDRMVNKFDEATAGLG
jgi:hypothetical protein